MDHEAKIKLALAIQERERRRAVAPLLFYDPHKGQEEAHVAISENRVVIVTCGNRWGKSHFSAAEAIAWCYGYRPWMVPDLGLTKHGDYPPRDQIPPEYWIRRPDGLPIQLPARVLVVTGLGMTQGIGRTMWPKLEGFLPKGVRDSPNFHVRRGAFSVPVEVVLPNGSAISFGSGEQSPMMFEGQNYTVMIIDEPPKKPIFGAAWRGLTDLYGRVIMTMTPIGPNAPWVYDEFEEGGRTDCKVISGSIWQNPHITEKAKQEFLDGGGFNDEERAARETGSWTFLSHRAFPQFDPDAHVVPANTPVPYGWVRGLACDPAHRRPFMLIWAAFGPDGEMFVYDEWPEQDHSQLRSSTYTVEDYSRIIAEREAIQGARPHFRCLDPRFGSATPTIKGERHTSIQDDFAKYNMFFDCCLEGTEREEIGISRVRELLRWDRKAPLSALNRPRIRVRANCVNTINALRLSNFVSPSLMDPDNLQEKMNEKYKDARDCLRYLILYPKHTGFDADDYNDDAQDRLEDFNSDDYDY